MAAAATLLLPHGGLGDADLAACGGDATEAAGSTTTPDDESEASGTPYSSGDGALGRLLAVFGHPQSQAGAAAGATSSAAHSPEVQLLSSLQNAAGECPTVELGATVTPEAFLDDCEDPGMAVPAEDEGADQLLQNDETLCCGSENEDPGEAALDREKDEDDILAEGSQRRAESQQGEGGGDNESDDASFGFSPSSTLEADGDASENLEDRGQEIMRLLRIGGMAPLPPPAQSLESSGSGLRAEKRAGRTAPEPPAPADSEETSQPQIVEAAERRGDAPKQRLDGGAELLRLVQGFSSERRPSCEVEPPSRPNTEDLCATSAGLFPMSLNAEPWEPLIRPIVDETDPKAFVNAELFSKKGGGISVTEGRTRPQVLVDRPDRGIMVMYKPSGWATCSTPHWEGNEGNLIRHVWRHLNAPTAAPCHRLDKGTSGIVVVAMSKVASKHICRQISQKKLVKQYLGLCHGHIVPAAGAMSAPLALSSTDKPLGTCSMEGREAVTRYRVLGYFGREPDRQYSLVQVQIDHGRQHQIRLHMASLGHPLVSDPKYNATALREDSEISPRLFLHACFLRCALPPGDVSQPELGGAGDLPEEEPFHVACRLPPDLKHALISVLVWQRELDGQLLPEASRVCECLLTPEHSPSCGDADSLHASRLVVRRRDDFLHRFGFNEQERAEVTRILSTLPTAKERSAALQQFRVLGQRTPDFIVTRFGKYVEGLLRWRKGDGEEDEEEEEEASGELSSSEAIDSSGTARDDDGIGQSPPETALPDPAEVEAAASSGVDTVASAGGDPIRRVPGPVRIHAESVWCDVCCMQERQVCLEVPWFCLRIRVPPQTTLPACFLAVTRPPCEEEAHSSNDISHGCPTWVEADGSRQHNQGRPVPPPPQGLRKQKEVELQQVVRDYVHENGNIVDGIWVASKIASRFNQWVRTNNKRNDGSLRRWVGTIPGISVEHCGKNKWRVHGV